MKKARNLSNKSSLIKLVSLMLLSSLLLACLSGCDLLEQLKSFAPDDSQDNSGVKNPNENTENKNTVLVPDGVDSDLIYALIDHLKKLNVQYDLPADNLDTKIDQILAGAQPLILDFTGSDYYYICGYYNCSEHDYERMDYPCAEKYKWVKYDKAEDIRDYIGELALVASFQINKTSFSQCVIPGDTPWPRFEHFMMYTPNFENGINTATACEYNDILMYLNSSDKSNAYFSTFTSYNSVVSMRCVKKGQMGYFITSLVRESDVDGNVCEIDLGSDFGKYYNELTGMIDGKEYTVTHENGTTADYALIAVNDFGNYLGMMINDAFNASTPVVKGYKTIVSYAGSNVRGVEEAALNSDKLSKQDMVHCPIFKVDTLQEFDEFKSRYDVNYGWDEIPSLSEATSEYSEEFFSENSLLIVYVKSGSCSLRYGVYDIQKNTDSLTVCIKQINNPDGGDDGMAGWWITVAIPDNELVGCRHYDACFDNTLK